MAYSNNSRASSLLPSNPTITPRLFYALAFLGSSLTASLRSSTASLLSLNMKKDSPLLKKASEEGLSLMAFEQNSIALSNYSSLTAYPHILSLYSLSSFYFYKRAILTMVLSSWSFIVSTKSF